MRVDIANPLSSLNSSEDIKKQEPVFAAIQIFVGIALAAWLCLPRLWLDRRALPIQGTPICAALPPMQGQHLPDGGHRHAIITYPALNLVLGRIPGDNADARPVRAPISTATGPFPL